MCASLFDWVVVRLVCLCSLSFTVLHSRKIPAPLVGLLPCRFPTKNSLSSHTCGKNQEVFIQLSDESNLIPICHKLQEECLTVAFTVPAQTPGVQPKFVVPNINKTTQNPFGYVTHSISVSLAMLVTKRPVLFCLAQRLHSETHEAPGSLNESGASLQFCRIWNGTRQYFARLLAEPNAAQIYCSFSEANPSKSKRVLLFQIVSSLKSTYNSDNHPLAGPSTAQTGHLSLLLSHMSRRLCQLSSCWSTWLSSWSLLQSSFPFLIFGTMSENPGDAPPVDLDGKSPALKRSRQGDGVDGAHIADKVMGEGVKQDGVVRDLFEAAAKDAGETLSPTGRLGSGARRGAAEA